jgi:hypothetical protein
MKDVKTVRQWSLVTGVPYQTILDAVRSGDLSALRFKDRGQIVVRSEDWDAWFEKARQRAIRSED